MAFLEDKVTEAEFKNILDLFGNNWGRKDKASFIHKLAGRVDMPDNVVFVGTDIFMEAAESGYSDRKENIAKAAEIAKRTNTADKVVKRYEKNEDFLHAARIAASLGMEKESKMNYGREIAKIVTRYGRHKELSRDFAFPEAAKVAEEAGFHTAAISMYQMSGKLSDAKRVASYLGMNNRVLVYETAIELLRS